MCDSIKYKCIQGATIKKLVVSALGCSMIFQVLANEAASVYIPIPAVDCVINPYRVADIASPVTGVIETINVERSQQVSKGQLVAQLEADVERANVELARYRASIRSEIQLGQVNQDFDTRRKLRFDSLRQQNVISVENLEEAEREADSSRWKLTQARELADVRKLELLRAVEQLNQKSIRAPFDGFVLDTFKHDGEYVEEQAILRLAQLNPLVIEAIVPMENFGKIKKGMLAEILPEILTDEKLTGQVRIVDRIGDTASNTFGVRLHLPNPENRIPAGLKCIVKFLQQTAPVIDEAELSLNQDVIERRQAPPLDEHQVLEEARPGEEDASGLSELSIDSEDETQVEYADENVAEAEGHSQDKIISETEIVMNDKPRGYLVLMPQGDTNQQARNIIKKFKDLGVHDFQEMNHGPYQGLISVGYYDELSNAEKRRKELEELGFSLFVGKRY